MRRLLPILFLTLLNATPVHAEDEDQAILARAEKQQVLDTLIEKIEMQYVYPEQAPAIGRNLKQELADGSYLEATTPAEFASALSTDLISFTNDQHFAVSYQPAKVGEALFENDNIASARRSNFGFERLDILPGNVGYMRFDYFPDPEPAYATLTSAMKFVENTDALIIDLRYNNGGYLETAQFIASHLFSTEKDQALFRYFYNDDGETVRRSQWVLAAVPGRRRPTVPVYILTSSTSFSAAEWMAYSLQELGRASVIGQTTTGAAHPVERFRLDDKFIIQIPIGKISGPIKGGDFEGKGVVPDHSVPSHRGLEFAYEKALMEMIDNGVGDDANWHLVTVRAKTVGQVELDRDLAAIQGAYDGRTFALEDGVLIYRWRERYSLALTPLGSGVFGVEGTEDYRFRLVFEDGRVSGVRREFQDGNSVFYKRID